MSIVQFLRKPYLAIFLASLTLFASCGQYDNELEDTFENIDLQTFVSKHLETSSKILNVLEQEKSIDFNEITEITNTNVSLEELKNKYKSVGVQKYNELSLLVFDLLQNSNNFAKSNQHLNLSEIDNSITAEIANQLNGEFSLFNRSNNCQKTYDSSMGRCHRNYAITTAISAVGMFMGGIAGAVGVLVAALALAECESSAWDALQDCNQQNSQ